MNINHINVDKGFVNPRKPPPPALRKYPLHKEADTTGVFWLPSDADKKIPGQLFFIPGGGVQLVLNGSFIDGPERQVEYSSINGVLAKGTNCTIFGPQGFIDQYHSNNVAYVTILHSSYYVAGECFGDEKTFNIDLLDVQFSHMEKWFNPPYDLISDFESTELLMCFNPDKFEVEIEWNDKIFIISTFCSRTVPMGAGENETTINYSYRFHIKTKEPYPAHIFLEVASVLRECLMFIIGTGVYTLDIKAIANHADKLARVSYLFCHRFVTYR